MWRAFYAIDPWGDQRADLRMARVVEACLAPHTQAKLDPNDYLLFPDDRHDLPDDIDARERAWMMKLQRSGD